MFTSGPIPGASYYTGGGGGAAKDAEQANYYVGAAMKGEPDGVWQGRLAEQLGLTGVVDAADMEAVYTYLEAPDGTAIGRPPKDHDGSIRSSVDRAIERAIEKNPGLLPEEVDSIRRQVERDSRSSGHGVDFTFGVPKTYTVLHTAWWRAEVEAGKAGDLVEAERFRSRREALEDAILASNDTAIEYAASIATARIGKGGSGSERHLAAPDLVATRFLQHTSRANDPHLHVHNPILSRARAEDGQIRALDTVSLVAQRHAVSAVGDRDLAERLAQMGIRTAVRPDGSAREVVGVDQELVDVFSQRRQQIVSAARPYVEKAEQRLGRELTRQEYKRLTQMANFSTRNSKGAESTDFAELLDEWQERLVAETGGGLLPLAHRMATATEDGPVAAEAFSPHAVGAEAVQRLAERQSAWSRADLMMEIELSLPLTGLTGQESRELLDSLTDFTLANHGVVQVAGESGLVPPQDLVSGSYVNQAQVLYAAPATFESERRIRALTQERGRRHVDAKTVSAWLDQNHRELGPDQRAAVVGIASSDSALTQLIGPAGTGKSYTAGVLSSVWESGAGGRVHGLAVSQNAAEILRGDGVLNSANIASWLSSQDRLEEGRPIAQDLARAVGPRDLVVIDEGSMVATPQLDRIRGIVASVGARLLVMHDPRQLGAVEAGGSADLLQDAEGYALADPRRFTSRWEGDASLALREGDRQALVEYDRRGRLLGVETLDEAISAAARAAAADRVDGRTVVVTADTNADANRIADAVRAHLVEAGAVEEVGVVLGRTGSLAGIGDEVMARQNDYQLGVVNRDRLEVVGTGEDGSLSVRTKDGRLVELPRTYVAEHVQLAYGSTVHAAQGATVDRSYTVTDGGTDANSLYVGMTRGRERNTAVVALRPELAQEAAPHVIDPDARPTAVSVLEGALERSGTSRSASGSKAEDAERLASMDTLDSRIELVTDLACRARMNADLDRLVDEGVLSLGDRVRIGADAAQDTLSRALRAAEQAGLDPQAVLRDAVQERSLRSAKGAASVVESRIKKAHHLTASVPGQVVPQRLPHEHARHLGELRTQAEDRVRELGTRVAEDVPAWATRTLGAVPDDPMQRLEWEVRAGKIAAYREAAGFLDGERAMPAAPGLSTTERRAAWWEAWEAAGRPEEIRAEAGMSTGQLRVRVAAWEREKQWAPAHADDAMRRAELDAEEARRDAILAEARGELEEAARLRDEAERQAAIARSVTDVADARAAWAAEVSVTRDLGERAAVELRSRGIAPGREPDRVTAMEWLEEHRRSMEAEDEYRPVSELDVREDHHEAGYILDKDEPVWHGEAPHREAEDESAAGAQLRAPVTPSQLELEALVAVARHAEERVTDRASEEAAYEAEAVGCVEDESASVAEYAGGFRRWPDGD